MDMPPSSTTTPRRARPHLPPTPPRRPPAAPSQLRATWSADTSATRSSSGIDADLVAIALLSAEARRRSGLMMRERGFIWLHGGRASPLLLSRVRLLEKDVRGIVRTIAKTRARVSAVHCGSQANNDNEDQVMSHEESKDVPASPPPSVVTDATDAHVEINDRDLGIAFPALLRGLTTKKDILHVKSLIHEILHSPPTHPSSSTSPNNISNDDASAALLSVFYEELITARNSLPPSVLRLEQTLPEDWYRSPWYVAYVQYTATCDAETEGTFETLSKMLLYIRNRLGIRNICLLPHYESPMGDGGYDVSSYTPRKSLGGLPQFQEFMDSAMQLGMNVATDLVFNHTSTEHEWFQKAIQGEEKYLRYYVQRNGREKIAEWMDEETNEIICQYRDINGCISERSCTFPDVDRTHGLWCEINNKTHQFYRSFYPFQIDLNLRNIDVIRECIRVIGMDLEVGVLGKRIDAAAHWIKIPGICNDDDLNVCHAVHQFFKCYMRHLHGRCITIPEVVEDLKGYRNYSGHPVNINSNVQCASEGDGVVAFEMQASLRESLYLQNISSVWKSIFSHSDILHNKSTWMNLLEHHDAIYLGYYAKGEVRRWMAEYIKSHNGVIYHNGILGAGRLFDALNQDFRRLAMAICLFYIVPGTPMLYAGLEIGVCSNWENANHKTKERHDIFERLGVYVDESCCFDPRELHRGCIPKSEFNKAIVNQQEYKGINTVRRLNHLSDYFGWFKSVPGGGGIVTPVMCEDLSVFVCLKECSGDDMFVLCILNLSAVKKDIELLIKQVDKALNIENENEKQLMFKNLINGTDVLIEVDNDLYSIRIKLDSFDTVMLIDPNVDPTHELQ